MYMINEVSGVNTKYIFFTFPDGKQDRKTVNKNHLKDLYTDVCNKMQGYEFMKIECEKVREVEKMEYNKLENIILGYEKYIKDNQNDPMVRRNLHDICWKYASAKKELTEKGCQILGVNKTWKYASDNYWKLFKLQKQIESVLKAI